MAFSKNNRTIISMMLISLFFLGISPAAAQDADALSTIDDALSKLKDALTKLNDSLNGNDDLNGNDTSNGNDASTGNDGDISVKCDSTSPDCCWATRILQQMGENISFSPSEPNACCGYPHDPEAGGSMLKCTDGNIDSFNFPTPQKARPKASLRNVRRR